MTAPNDTRKSMTVSEAEALCRAEGLAAQLDAAQSRNYDLRQQCGNLSDQLRDARQRLEDAGRQAKLRGTAFSALTVALMAASLWLGWQARIVADGAVPAFLPDIGCTLPAEPTP